MSVARAWRAACVCVFLLWAAGCTTVTQDLGRDTLWGRLVLQIGPGERTPAQQWSAGFELRGSAQAGELALTSPLGTTVAQARWRPGTVELQQGGGHRLYADLDELSRELLGEPIPLQALFDWLRGRPWPAFGHEPTPQGFRQHGWTVDLSGWKEGRVTARRDEAPAIVLRASLQSAP